jgi:hypothetical protein
VDFLILLFLKIFSLKLFLKGSPFPHIYKIKIFIYMKRILEFFKKILGISETKEETPKVVSIPVSKNPEEAKESLHQLISDYKEEVNWDSEFVLPKVEEPTKVEEPKVEESPKVEEVEESPKVETAKEIKNRRKPKVESSGENSESPSPDKPKKPRKPRKPKNTNNNQPGV